MHPRVFALGLACMAGALALPAAAQGVRVPGARPATSLPLGTASTAPQSADFIVAVVNSEPVTRNELVARMERVRRQLERDGGAMPSNDQLAREVLERIVVEKVQLQQAQAQGVSVDDLAIDQAEASVAQQNSVSREAMHRKLAADGISVAQFRSELRTQLVLQRLRQRAVNPNPKVSEFDIDQYLRAQQPKGSQAALSINLGNILVSVPENASAAVVAEREARAKTVAERARAGGDFAQLAREFSDAPQAATGGAMGLRPADRYPELFLDATRSLAVGGIAGPLRSGAGFHVLKVLERSQGEAAAPSVEQIHARHILLRTGPQLSEAQAAAKLADMRKEIVAGRARFESLAREHSQDGSAEQGGDLGWSMPGRFVPEFEAALEALKPNEVSQPVVTRFGVHLIELIERRQVKLNPREQREMAREILRQKKVDDEYADWAREQRERAFVEYRDLSQ